MNSDWVSVGPIKIDLCNLNAFSEPACSLADHSKFSVNQIWADRLVAVRTYGTAEFFCNRLIFQNKLNLNVVGDAIFVSNLDRALTTHSDIFKSKIDVYWAIIWENSSGSGLEGRSYKNLSLLLVVIVNIKECKVHVVLQRRLDSHTFHLLTRFCMANCCFHSLRIPDWNVCVNFCVCSDSLVNYKSRLECSTFGAKVHRLRSALESMSICSAHRL